MVKRRRRRRDARTQRPNSITVRRVGTGRATELTTFSWVNPPSAWDATAAGMAGQVRKAKRATDKRQKKARWARRESVKEARAEKWRAKFRQTSSSPFATLPGMGGRTETSRKPRAITATERQAAGLASRGSSTSLTPELACTILKLRGQGASYREISEATGRPRATVGHWLRSGRATAVVSARGRD